MLDLQEARLRADHQRAFKRFVTDLAAQLREAFEALAAIQYDQPWQRGAGGTRP